MSTGAGAHPQLPGQSAGVLPEIARACPATRQHLASRRQLLAAGVGPQAIVDCLESGALVRVRRGVYAPAALAAPAEHLVSGGRVDVAYLAHTRAALMSHGETAVAGGRTAAALWGFDMFVEPAAVELVVPASRNRRSRPGVKLMRYRGARAVRLRVLGSLPVRVLSALDTVVHCALTRPLREAVVIADSALRSRKITLSQLQRAVLSVPRDARARRLRRVVDLVDPLSASVLETLTRLLFVEHGLSPETQVVLVDAEARFIGRVDFLFREQRLVVECDGRRWHDPDDARARDRSRDNELERAAWRLLRITWADVVHRPHDVIRLVLDCLQPWPQVT